jgi:hypothetical protein
MMAMMIMLTAGTLLRMTLWECDHSDAGDDSGVIIMTKTVACATRMLGA